MKPPAKIAGKSNPAYSRWWRKANPAAYRAAHNRAVTKFRQKLHNAGIHCAMDECKCIECGQTYKKSDPKLVTAKVLHRTAGHRILCPECFLNERLALRFSALTF
jgi:hypothetical protein